MTNYYILLKIEVPAACLYGENALYADSAEVYYEFAKTFDLPQNGYGSNTKYADSIIKYYNISLVKGMDSAMVIDKRRHEWSAKGDYENAIQDHWWMYYNAKWFRGDYPFRH